MTELRTAPRADRRIRPARLRLLAMATPLVLIGFGLAPPAAATPPPNAATNATAAASRPQPLQLPSLRASSYTVTLITGNQVKLTATGTGRYTATAIPTPGASPTLNFTGLSRPNGASSIFAEPPAAQALIASGKLNPGLFDVAYLAEHGDTSPTASIPVIIRYSGHPSVATLADKVHHLPGATLKDTLPASSEVKLSVTANHAAAFWTALTDGTAARPAWPAVAVRLANGANSVRLDGHQVHALTSQYHPQPDQAPAATVTVTTTKKQGEVFGALGCAGNPTSTTLCLEGDPILVGVAGTGTGTSYSGTTSCVDTNPCKTYETRFSVPPGVYMTSGFGFFLRDNRSQNIDLIDPQFTVAGDTHVTIDADTAQQITISGPQPTAFDSFYATFGHYRSLPDGTNFVSFGQSAYGYQSNWTTTGGGQVTVGTFHTMNAIVTGAPPVTMTVTAPRQIGLHPIYPDYTVGNPARPFVRFSGRQTLEVVDAGYGQPSDFAGLDVRGKLVLLRIFRAKLGETGCSAYPDQLQRALDAGAAGVLIDPSEAKSAFDSFVNDCGLPVLPDWWFNQEEPVDIPYVAIPPGEASTLRGLLAHGRVRVNVTDSGPTSYVYAVSPTSEGHLPASEHYTFTSRELTGIDDNFHAAQPGTSDYIWAPFRPNDYFGASGLYEYLPASTTVREYIGPNSPDVVWWRIPTNHFSFDVFGQHGGSMTNDWSAQPAAPGTPADALNAALQAQPGKWNHPGNDLICAYCRQGNTFYPVVYNVAGANPNDDSGGFVYTAGSTSIHLYNAAGSEIPQTSYQGLATFALPSQQARYRLTTDDADTHTTWHFTSAEPSSDQSPPGFSCLDSLVTGSTTPCRADPLVFLRYNAFTDLSNAVSAPGGHKLQVTGYHQDPTAPPIINMQLWFSTNGGTTWQQLHLTSQGGSAWLATYDLPPLSSTNGHVSLKATARDTAGNDVSQTIINAYGIAASK